MTEDFEFAVTVVCCKYGMGSWSEVLSLPFEIRRAFYLTIAKLEGLDVDWSTGRVYRPHEP